MGALTFYLLMGTDCSRPDPSISTTLHFTCTVGYQLQLPSPSHRYSLTHRRYDISPLRGWIACWAISQCACITFAQSYLRNQNQRPANAPKKWLARSSMNIHNLYMKSFQNLRHQQSNNQINQVCQAQDQLKTSETKCVICKTMKNKYLTVPGNQGIDVQTRWTSSQWLNHRDTIVPY